LSAAATSSHGAAMPARTFSTIVPPAEYAGTDEEAQDLLHLCLKKIHHYPDDYFGFDTETTGKKLSRMGADGELEVVKIGKKTPLDWMSDTVTYWSLAFFDPWEERYRRWCIPGEHFRYFSPFLENPNAWLAIWNAKYDAHVSWNMGINIWNAKIIDGFPLAGLHDENKIQRNIKACAYDWCGLPMTKFKDLFPTHTEDGVKVKEYETDLRTLPLDKVSDYASYDSFCHLFVVLWLRDRLREALIDNSGWSLWDYFIEMERKVTEVLWRMERRGILVDANLLRDQLPLIDKRIRELQWDINRVAKADISVTAPKQLAALFFGPPIPDKVPITLGLNIVKMTDSGKDPSTDKEVMELLELSGIELAKTVVKCKSLKKTRSTYLTSLIDLTDCFQDGRIHPNFNQYGARTGRFSTDTPNSQNFPRPDGDEWGIRRAFVSPPGCKLIVSDYEQLEMRIMAHMSGDKAMIKAIREGKDLHSFTVSRMIPGVTYEEVVAAKKVKDHSKLTDRQKWLLRLRQDMKAVGFGIFYGAGPQTIATQITILEEEVHRRIKELAAEEAIATEEDISKGRTLSQRIERAQKYNAVLTTEKAMVKVARESIAQDKIDAYFKTFPDVKIYMNQMPKECKISKIKDFNGQSRYRPKNAPGTDKYDWDMGLWWNQKRPLTRTGHLRPFGHVKTFCGRYRRLEDIDHKNYRFNSEARRQSVNVTIQGSASDIIKAAMLRIERDRRLNELQVEMVNQIHDELVLECPDENVEEAMPIVEECMIHPFSPGREALCIPLPVDIKAVDCWANAK
jgi:DNA polymerase I-like protein with 3'-5' exonuclease and polymerase domains